MPDAQWLNATNVQNALNDTSLEMATLDRALVRRFTQMFRFGHFEKPYAPTEIPAAEHGAISRRMGQQMAVLLKNDAGRLPLAKDAGKVLLLKGGASLAEVVKALNAIGATPQDLLAILQAMKAAGALRAELEII